MRSSISLTKDFLQNYRTKKYAPKTIQYWLSSYLKNGIEALKPGYRNEMASTEKLIMSLKENTR